MPQSAVASTVVYNNRVCSKLRLDFAHARPDMLSRDVHNNGRERLPKAAANPLPARRAGGTAAVLFRASSMPRRGASARMADSTCRRASSAPENIFYLTGLDHWGYFAPHLLIVPATGELVLVTRAMERVTVERQVAQRPLRGPCGQRDRGRCGAPASLDDLGLAAAADRLRGLVRRPAARAGRGAAARPARGRMGRRLGLVDALRMVKSPAEQALMRAGGAASPTPPRRRRSRRSAPGASERDVAAACQRAMIARRRHVSRASAPSSAPPRGSARSTRPGATRGFAPATAVFLELSGCVARYHAPLGRLVHVGARPR